ncbi:MAG: YifB family Mg chelatase-like AAA ATPase [Clostridia bacterium]
MAVIINASGIYGIDGYKVSVECELSKGMPGFTIVGLPDTAVRESSERVRSSMKNNNYFYPIGRVTINLAPADVKKEGTIYDLPIMLAIMLANEQISDITSDNAFVGELSLNGEIRPVSGALSMAISLKENGIKNFFVPMHNAIEASFCDGINIFAVENVSQVIAHINGDKKIKPFVRPDFTINDETQLDFADVVGQQNVIRACELCAAGRHNLLLCGSQGSGKSMVAKRLSTIMPKLTKDEQLEVIKINSSMGFTKNNLSISDTPPFRSPHHTVSAIALSGGLGANKVPKPGEISLAHHGILFLDEFPEFQKAAIDSLRAPIEDKKVTIARVSASITYPSEFILVAAMNPCKCGWYGDKVRHCICTPKAVQSYNAKISGPILDRIDIFVNVTPVAYDDLHTRKKGESSKDILKRVLKAREIQEKRFVGTNIKYNSDITPDKIKEFCSLDDAASEILRQAFARLNMTARSHDRILKLARTIADLDGSEQITANHIAEAIQYRKQETR